ncbi:MAG: DEAD-box ATP-dependent RNA helicase [Chaenotheca gracillima]|nr:MAG: DEAD-box ATP-dependent RNA helicase [Chaenotheca gracillima]
MAESTATPRVLAPYLENFVNQTVRIVGKVVQTEGDQIIDAGGNITAHLNRESHLTLNNAVEIVGKVNPDLSVKVLVATDFGSNLDMKAVSAVVDATHRYKEIFYESSPSAEI